MLLAFMKNPCGAEPLLIAHESLENGEIMHSENALHSMVRMFQRE